MPYQAMHLTLVKIEGNLVQSLQASKAKGNLFCPQQGYAHPGLR